jgi:Ni/Co efflux regulator RcnB
MKTMTATFAALLLAGVATAALAQDQEHRDRGDHWQRPAGQAAAPAQAPAPQAQPRAPMDGHARFGAPAGPQAGPAQPAAPIRNIEGRNDHRFQGGAPGQAPNGAPLQPRFDRGGPSGLAQRPNEHERGPREVVPPAADNRQFDRRDGREAYRDLNHNAYRNGGRDIQDARRDGGNWNGDRRDGDRHDGGANPWRRGDHWQAGRAPPVFWSQSRYRIGGYRAPYGYYVRTWGFGDFLPRGWYGQDYWIGDFLDYGLPYPPPGYEWVRVGGDALMIDRYSGRIVQVVRGIFW